MWIGSVLVLGVVALGTEARGAEGKDVQQNQATLARKACLSGDYQKGVALLADLFLETKDPMAIFNQGRCFEQNGRYEAAITRFDEYLRVTKNSNAKDRRDAEEHVAECHAKLEKARSLTPLSPESAPSGSLNTSAPIVAGHATGKTGGSTMRLAGIAVGIAGVAALGTAVVLNLKANGMADDLNRPTGYERSKASDRSTYQTLGYVGYGVGAGCLLGGVALYALGARSDASSVALVPNLVPGQASLALQGVF